MAINSYTKSNGDLLLLSALWRIPAQVGFYIDAGSGQPEHDSVTNLLYEKGWRGINIEPSPDRFARLTETRKRDINIEAVTSTRPERSYSQKSSASRPTTSWTHLQIVIPTSRRSRFARPS